MQSIATIYKICKNCVKNKLKCLFWILVSVFTFTDITILYLKLIIFDTNEISEIMNKQSDQFVLLLTCCIFKFLVKQKLIILSINSSIVWYCPVLKRTFAD